MIKCPTCGTMNEPGSRFCFQCGTQLEQRTDAPPPPSSGPTVITGSSAPPPPPSGGFGNQQGGFSPPGGFSGQQSGFPPPGDIPPQYPPGQQWSPPGYMMPPEPPRRRRWLWITLGTILGCILLCVAFFIWASTVGEERLNDWATQLSEFSTEQSEP